MAPRHPSTGDEAPPRRPEGVKMLEGKPTPAGSDHVATGYSYPGDLARFVRDRWRDVPEPPSGVDPLPDAAALEGFYAACYQASMLREGAPGRLPRHPRRARALRPRGEATREPAAARVSPLAPFDPRELRRL